MIMFVTVHVTYPEMRTSFRYNPKMTRMHEAHRAYVVESTGKSINECFETIESAKKFYAAWKADVLATVPSDRKDWTQTTFLCKKGG